MKQLILIIHLVSGQVLEIVDVYSVNKLRQDLNSVFSTFKGPAMLNIEGSYVYLNKRHIEYVEEKYIDAFDPKANELLQRSHVEGIIDHPEDTLEMEQV